MKQSNENTKEDIDILESLQKVQDLLISHIDDHNTTESKDNRIQFDFNSEGCSMLVHSNELSFSELKKEANDLLKFMPIKSEMKVNDISII